MLKLQMYSTMSSWATSIFNPKTTEALTPRRHFWLTLQPINIMLNYKILPYDHSKVLRTNIKTTLWDLVPLSRRLQCYSITGLFIMALLFKLPWTAPTTWSITSSLDSFSNIIPVDKVSSGKSFFLVFTLQCQWVKQSCRREHQRAKWNPLLIFNWQWICSWRKNRARAPFPRAQLKPFNQKKVEWGRKGEDKRFGFKLKKPAHIYTIEFRHQHPESSSYPKNILLCNLNNSNCKKAKLKEGYQKGKKPQLLHIMIVRVYKYNS